MHIHTSIPEFKICTGLLSLVLASGLTACGGGGDEVEFNNTPPEAVYTEGSQTDPVDITGMLPYKGAVSPNLSSYYIVRNLDPGATYIVTLYNLYSDADLSVSPGGQSSRSYTNDESVAGAGGRDYLVIRVSDRSDDYIPRYHGTTFMLNVAPDGGTAQPYGEGSSFEPLDISGLLPYNGFIGVSGVSYYRISQLPTGGLYELRIIPVDGFNNDFLTANVPQPEYCYVSSGFNGVYSCPVKPYDNGSGVGVIDIEYNGASAGDDYREINIQLYEIGDYEGSVGSPIELNYTPNMHYHGMVSGSTNSYYRVSGLNPGQS